MKRPLLFCLLLGLIFLGTPAQAQHPLEESAAHGMGVAQGQLASHYLNGTDGVQKNLGKAYYWFSLCTKTVMPAETTNEVNSTLHTKMLWRLPTFDDSDGWAIGLNVMAGNLSEECQRNVQALHNALSDAERKSVQKEIDLWVSQHPESVIHKPQDPESDFWTQRIYQQIMRPSATQTNSLAALLQKPYDKTALDYLFMRAAEVNNLHALQTLEKEGAVIHFGAEKIPYALIGAVENGATETALYLLDQGTAIDSEKATGAALVELSFRKRRFAIAEALLKKGVTPDEWLQETLDACPLKSRVCPDGETVYNRTPDCTFETCPATAPKPAPKEPLVDHPANARSRDIQTQLREETSLATLQAIESQAQNYNTPVVFYLADAFFDHAQDDKALYWLYTAELRALTDKRLCPREKYFDTGNWGRKNTEDIRQLYIRYSPDKIRDIINNVVAEDKKISTGYNRQWGHIPSRCLNPARQTRMRDGIRAAFLQDNVLRGIDLQSLPINGMRNMDDLAVKAEAGDVDAQYELGECYRTTQHCTSSTMKVAPDPQKALYWLQRAADKGNHNALRSFALIYMQGLGDIPADFKKACDIMLSLQSQGSPQVYSLMAHSVPWIKEARTPQTKYAWSMVAHAAKGSEMPFVDIYAEAPMTDEELHTAEALGQSYVQKYIVDKAPLCTAEDLTIPTGKSGPAPQKPKAQTK